MTPAGEYDDAQVGLSCKRSFRRITRVDRYTAQGEEGRSLDRGTIIRPRAFDRKRTSGKISHLLALRASIGFSSFAVAKHASLIHLVFVSLGDEHVSSI